MKKIATIVICAASFATVCNANPVTPEQARHQAALILGLEEPSVKRMVGTRQAVAQASSEYPAYYFFTGRDGGFAIVSGDDALTPVLGYSTTSTADPDNLPPGLKDWLAQVSAAVSQVRALQGTPNAPAVAKGWNDEDGGRIIMRAGSNKVLEVATWNQGYPYNWYAPNLSNLSNSESQRSVTGCVSTAMSMVLRYHQWPPCGHGMLPDYEMPFFTNYESSDDYILVHMPGHELGHEYKWEDMPMEDISSYGTSTPNEGARQVARLMYDCGIMMMSEYSYYYGTGAYSQDIPEALISYMYYQDTAEYVEKSSYNNTTWFNLIKGQIDQDLPVLYGATASNNSGGHQFVVCGYDNTTSTNKFYVNWGWGGECDGLFSLTSFRPDGDDLTANHSAIINLVPDRSVNPEPHETEEPSSIKFPKITTPSNLYLKAGTYSSTTYNGVELASGTIEKGKTFKMKAGVLTNPKSSTVNAALRFDRYDSNGNYIETLGSASNISVSSKGKSAVKDVSCTASDVNVGDRIYLVNTNGGSASIVEAYGDGITMPYYPMVPYYFINPETKTVFNGADSLYGAVVSTEANAYVALLTMIVEGSYYSYYEYEYIVQEFD